MSRFLLCTAMLLIVFVLGVHIGTRSVERVKLTELGGSVSSDEVSSGLVEHKADTVCVLSPQTTNTADISTTNAPDRVVPIDRIEQGDERDAALLATATDWSTLRTYSGVMFDSPNAGRVTYSFPVQFNKVGGIDYTYTPPTTYATVATPKKRIRPMIVCDMYTNGQHSFGVGAQYGSFGLSARALKPPSGKGYAFGIGAQIIF